MLVTDSTPIEDEYEPSPRPQVQEAYENLRMIRQMMERSTKHSSLSGFSGIIVGLWAIIGVAVTRLAVQPNRAHHWLAYIAEFAATWAAVLVLSILTDLLVTKRRAALVGKHVFSKLGTHIVGAAAPGFTAGFVLTMYLLQQQRIGEVYGFWMLSYGLAICAVGLFSVRPVLFLGWAFLLAGAATLFLPHAWGLGMMALSFGGFHIAYGLYTGATRRDW